MGKRKRLIAILAGAAVLVTAACLLIPQIFMSDAVTVYYNNGGVEMPLTIEGVTDLRIYTLKGELYQIAAYVPWRERAIVFTQTELLGWEAPTWHRYHITTYIDQFHHTYDPYLQGIKLELNKEYIAGQYQLCFGRAPTQEELNLGLSMLYQKVQRIDYEWRLQNSPEALAYAQAQQGQTPDDGAIRAQLAAGAVIDA